VPQVFDAAVAAASGLGFYVSQFDRHTGHLYVDEPRRLGRSARRFAVSVTDSGLGSTVLHIAWHPRNTMPWPLRSEGRSAARLARQTERALAVGRFARE
jgi:hypothetical protein